MIAYNTYVFICLRHIYYIFLVILKYLNNASYWRGSSFMKLHKFSVIKTICIKIGYLFIINTLHNNAQPLD